MGTLGLKHGKKGRNPILLNTSTLNTSTVNTSTGNIRPWRSPAVLLACLMMLSACASADTSAVDTVPTVAPATAAPVPTATPVPQPTSTPFPTATPAPTATAEPTVTPEPTATPVPPTATPIPPPAPGTEAPGGQQRALPATTAEQLAQDLVWAEQTLRDPTADAASVAAAGRLQQVTYRRWSSEDSWDATVWAQVPAELVTSVELQLGARREFRDMPTGLPTADYVPAWAIIEPAPAADLLAWYQEAQNATGIGWEYLAAINLVETGMGRISGLSTAGAQGPMQFLPTTWAEVSTGDINDPRDAINAAAIYLDRRGGPEDMNAALWGYNNSDHYVRAVTLYAEIMRQDPATFYGFYHWEIFFFTTEGDLWLPVGYYSNESQDVVAYLTNNPWSAAAE